MQECVNKQKNNVWQRLRKVNLRCSALLKERSQLLPDLILPFHGVTSEYTTYKVKTIADFLNGPSPPSCAAPKNLRWGRDSRGSMIYVALNLIQRAFNKCLEIWYRRKVNGITSAHPDAARHLHLQLLDNVSKCRQPALFASGYASREGGVHNLCHFDVEASTGQLDYVIGRIGTRNPVRRQSKRVEITSERSTREFLVSAHSTHPNGQEQVAASTARRILFVDRFRYRHADRFLTYLDLTIADAKRPCTIP